MSGERHEWLKQPAPPWDAEYVPPPAPLGVPSPSPAQAPPESGGDRWFGPILAATFVLLVVVVSLALMLSARHDDELTSLAGGATQQQLPGTVAPAPTPTPQPTPTPAPGGSGSGATPAQPGAAAPIEPGTYVAMGSANIEGVGDDTALEFKVEGTGDDAKITYVVGFGAHPTSCRSGAAPPPGAGTTFLDDEVKEHSSSAGGTALTSIFVDKQIHIEAESPGRVTGAFRFAFDGSGCRGRMRFVANLQRPGQPTLYDQVMRAAR